MPTIAYFYGIAIQMFYADHSPPHFHARYGRARAIIRIADGKIISGNCRRRRAGLSANGRWRGGANWKKIGAAHARKRRWSVFRGRITMADEFPMVDVLKLKPLAERKLWLRFTDAYEGVCDLSEMIEAGGPMVEPLRDDSYFARVFVEMGAPTWPNGFDLDPINLYMELKKAGRLQRVAAA